MKTAIQVLRIFFGIILSAMILCNLWLLIDETVFKNDPPGIFGYSRLLVGSGSMEPEFSAGDIIFIHEEESYELGEVVTFRDSSGNLVTHRLVGTVDSQFITRGDANNTEDRELLPPENIVGAYVFHIPGMGGVVEFLRSPLGMALLLVAGIVIIELPVLFGRPGKTGGKHSRE